MSSNGQETPKRRTLLLPEKPTSKQATEAVEVQLRELVARAKRQVDIWHDSARKLSAEAESAWETMQSFEKQILLLETYMAECAEPGSTELPL